MSEEKDPLGRTGNMLYRTLRRLKKEEILKLCTKFCEHGHNFLEHPKCFGEMVPEEKVGFLDIESSNLVADFGFIISYAIKDAASGKIYGRVLSPKEILSAEKDKKLVRECSNDIKRFDRIITYYGARFDIPYIRTRAIRWNVDFPLWKEVHHTDAYFIVRNRFKLHRNRLETACSFFGINAKDHPMKPDQWTGAISGNKKDLNYIWTHNKEDVDSLEELWELINEFAQLNKTSM